MINKLCKVLFFALLFTGLTSKGATVNKTIYINKGIFTTVIGTTFPSYAFNDSPQYSTQNACIQLKKDDILILKVINTDSVTHGFDVKRYANVNTTINAKDSIIDTLKFSSEGVFIFYDSYQYPKYRYMGASSMITVFNSITDKKFYWNVKEHEAAYNKLLAENKKVDWSTYTPDYFTINGFSFPDVELDTVSYVMANVGDTIHLFIANTGQSAHALHIHGFHGKAIYSSISGEIGWQKDTFPVKSMETIIIELVPDKPGFYSIHDHNLLSGSANGLFSRGMLTRMNFK